MKVRGKHRPRRPRATVYDRHWRPLWPQPNIDRIELHSWRNNPQIGMHHGQLVVAARTCSGYMTHPVAQYPLPDDPLKETP